MKMMKLVLVAYWNVPKAASSVTRPSRINGTTQLMLVSASDVRQSKAKHETHENLLAKQKRVQ